MGKVGTPRSVPIANRFWQKVDASGDCWLWTGARTPTGYGQIQNDNKQRISAHRYVWETLIGPIPQGLEIDHLCRVRHCVNPDHLDVVTHRENLRRSHAIGRLHSKRWPKKAANVA